jgi:hypothetical protein
MDELNIIAKQLYGRVEVSSWLEFDGTKYVGMGMKTVYDRDGNVVERGEPQPTGLVAEYR